MPSYENTTDLFTSRSTLVWYVLTAAICNRPFGSLLYSNQPDLVLMRDPIIVGYFIFSTYLFCSAVRWLFCKQEKGIAEHIDSSRNRERHGERATHVRRRETGTVNARGDDHSEKQRTTTFKEDTKAPRPNANELYHQLNGIHPRSTSVRRSSRLEAQQKKDDRSTALRAQQQARLDHDRELKEAARAREAQQKHEKRLHQERIKNQEAMDRTSKQQEQQRQERKKLELIQTDGAYAQRLQEEYYQEGGESHVPAISPLRQERLEQERRTKDAAIAQELQRQSDQSPTTGQRRNVESIASMPASRLQVTKAAVDAARFNGWSNGEYEVSVATRDEDAYPAVKRFTDIGCGPQPTPSNGLYCLIYALKASMEQQYNDPAITDVEAFADMVRTNALSEEERELVNCTSDVRRTRNNFLVDEAIRAAALMDYRVLIVDRNVRPVANVIDHLGPVPGKLDLVIDLYSGHYSSVGRTDAFLAYKDVRAPR